MDVCQILVTHWSASRTVCLVCDNDLVSMRALKLFIYINIVFSLHKGDVL